MSLQYKLKYMGNFELISKKLFLLLAEISKRMTIFKRKIIEIIALKRKLSFSEGVQLNAMDKNKMTWREVVFCC